MARVRRISWPQRPPRLEKILPLTTLPQARKCLFPHICLACPPVMLSQWHLTPALGPLLVIVVPSSLSPRSPSRGGQPNHLSPSVELSYSGKTGPHSTSRCTWSSFWLSHRVGVLNDSATPTGAVAAFTASSAPPSLGYLDTRAFNWPHIGVWSHRKAQLVHLLLEPSRSSGGCSPSENPLPGATPTILSHRWDIGSARAGGALGRFAPLAAVCRAVTAVASLHRYPEFWWRHCGLAALRVTGRGDGELARDPDS